jgi:preprotein translocase subunit SecG
MQDKRRTNPREGADRRMIERFSDGRVSAALTQTKIWLRVLAGFLIVAAIAEVIRGCLNGVHEILFAVFIGTFLALFAILLLQYSTTINYYLKNESVNNLSAVHDRELTLWKTTGIFAILFLIIYIVFQF